MARLYPASKMGRRLVWSSTSMASTSVIQKIPRLLPGRADPHVPVQSLMSRVIRTLPVKEHPGFAFVSSTPFPILGIAEARASLVAVGFSGEESPDTLNFASVAFGHHFGPAVLVETGSPTAGEKSLNTLMQLAGYVGDAEPFRTSLRVEGQLWLADAMVSRRLQCPSCHRNDQWSLGYRRSRSAPASPLATSAWSGLLVNSSGNPR